MGKKKTQLRLDEYRKLNEIIYEMPDIKYFKVPELDNFGYRYIDIPGYNGRYILSEKGIVYERVYNSSGKLVYRRITAESDNFFRSKENNNERGEKNKYPTVYLIKPNGRGKYEHTDELTNIYFNGKPSYILESAVVHNHLFDSKIMIDPKTLKTARNNAKEYCLSSEDVRFATSSDIQKDSFDKGRNSGEFLKGSKETAVSDYETGELLYIFDSVDEAGKHSTAPNGHGGNVSNCRLGNRPYYYMIIDGSKRKVTARDTSYIDADTQRIFIKKTKDIFKSVDSASHLF